MRTLEKRNKTYIVQKVLVRAIQKCNFYWIWATVSKVMGIYVKFTKTKYGHVTWLWLQIPKIFIFRLILY